MISLSNIIPYGRGTLPNLIDLEALGVSLGKAANRCDMISCFVDGDEWVMQEVDDRQRVFEKRGKEEDIVKKVYGNIKLRIRPQK